MIVGDQHVWIQPEFYRQVATVNNHPSDKSYVGTAGTPIASEGSIGVLEQALVGPQHSLSLYCAILFAFYRLRHRLNQRTKDFLHRFWRGEDVRDVGFQYDH